VLGVVGVVGAGGLAEALALVSDALVSLAPEGAVSAVALLPLSVEVVPFASALLLGGLAEE
jgi:hypothetical protein